MTIRIGANQRQPRPLRGLARFGLAAIACMLTGCSPSGPALSVTDFRLSDAPPGASARAAYLTISNNSDQTRELVRASSNAYRIVEFHRTEIVDNQSSMRREDTVAIGPGETVVFEPFGRHLMLMAANEISDPNVSILLCFDDGHCIDVAASP